jgi:hypothetical protein
VDCLVETSKMGGGGGVILSGEEAKGGSSTMMGGTRVTSGEGERGVGEEEKYSH